MAPTARGYGKGMRVLIDATAIPANRGGVGRYVDELIPALAALGVELVIVAQRRDDEFYRGLAPNAQVVSISKTFESVPARLIWEQLLFPFVIRKLKPDVVHSPHYTMPFAARRRYPIVVTMHDMTFFTSPYVHLGVKGRFFRSMIRRSVGLAAGIITPSVATKDELVRLVGASPNKVTVAYHGVDQSRFHPVSDAEIARVRATLELPADMPYIAFLGTLEPRKNVPALIAAWVMAAQRLPADQVPALILAGAKGWDEQIETALAEVPPDLTVRLPGYLPLDDLPGFLAGAQVLAYPSLGEGFGLPVLEAMACGACVLTTRRLSLPEVGGDAVAYCEPDVAAIADALVALCTDPARRRALAQAAIIRAQSFTWAAAAQAHLRAYQSALRPSFSLHRFVSQISGNPELRA